MSKGSKFKGQLLELTFRKGDIHKGRLPGGAARTLDTNAARREHLQRKLLIQQKLTFYSSKFNVEF
jgi:hypothetical protein